MWTDESQLNLCLWPQSPRVSQGEWDMQKRISISRLTLVQVTHLHMEWKKDKYKHPLFEELHPNQYGAF